MHVSYTFNKTQSFSPSQSVWLVKIWRKLDYQSFRRVSRSHLNEVISLKQITEAKQYLLNVVVHSQICCYDLEQCGTLHTLAALLDRLAQAGLRGLLLLGAESGAPSCFFFHF